jgi:hypothetical protein
MREKEEEGTVPGPVKVKHFISVELTDDGNDVLLDTVFEAGTSSILKVPYRYAEHLAGRVQRCSRGAGTAKGERTGSNDGFEDG